MRTAAFLSPFLLLAVWLSAAPVAPAAAFTVTPSFLVLAQRGTNLAHRAVALGLAHSREVPPPALLRRRPPIVFERVGAVAAAAAVSGGAAGEDDDEMDMGAQIDGELERLNAILASGGPDAERLGKALSQIEKGASKGKPEGRLEKAIKKKSGAFSSLVEFCVEEGSEQEVQDVSRACRMGKAAAIIIDVGFALQGRDRDTTLVVLAEQAKSKGNFPGPCPVVLRHCGMVDPVQVAEVAALGISAIMLPSALLTSSSPDADGAAVFDACAALGLEVVVEVDDTASVQAALGAGARMLCVRGVGSLDEALQLRDAIPKECAALVAVPAQQVYWCMCLCVCVQVHTSMRSDGALIL